MKREPTVMELRCVQAIIGHEPNQEHALEIVRDVINAMRGITSQMMSAGTTAADDAMDSDWSSSAEGDRYEYQSLRSDAPAEIWKAMIDVASPPEKKK